VGTSGTLGDLYSQRYAPNAHITLGESRRRIAKDFRPENNPTEDAPVHEALLAGKAAINGQGGHNKERG
jgi:hypothetical protein